MDEIENPCFNCCKGEMGECMECEYGEVWVGDAGCVYSISAITHLMPPPQPPEVKQDEK